MVTDYLEGSPFHAVLAPSGATIAVELPARKGFWRTSRPIPAEAQPFEDDLLTIPEAHRRLRISKWALYTQFIHTNRLTLIKIGRRSLILKRELDALIDQLKEGNNGRSS